MNNQIMTDSMSQKVAITDWTFPDLKVEEQIMSRNNVLLAAMQCKKADELIRLVSDADVVITQFAKIDAPVIGAMKKARAIVRYGIGVDNVDLEAARVRDIPVCNVPDYCIDEVADHTMALILALTRQVVVNMIDVRTGGWGLAAPLTSMQSLKGLTAGVIGFGRIGREVVSRLVAFKCRVLVLDPIVPAAEILKTKAEVAQSFEHLLPQSDVITLHCPSTPNTRRMFSKATFEKMKKGALFINVSRGDLVDSTALVGALQNGKLAGAALDVFDPEPIPEEHPIRKMPNVILTAHIASVSPSAVQKLRESAANIAILAMRGEPLPNVVNGIHTKDMRNQRS
jgi:D-3-phosphoglycerate dehydrogenase